LYEGALPQQVDAVVTKFGMPMGPFAMGDLAGLDIGWRSRKDRGIKSEIADALCEAGRFGQKTGKGYYKYEGGSRAPLPDPEVEKLIEQTLQRLGRKRRAVSDEEILERMMYPMINEGAAAARCIMPTRSASSTSPTGCRIMRRRPTIPRSSRRPCSSASPPKARHSPRWRRQRKRLDGD
jgi:3-hydroxyacyl-CoA dehydrogenase